VSLAISGILTGVDCEVPRIACVLLQSLWFFISNLLCFGGVLKPTELLFPEEERLVDSNVSFWHLYRGKFGL
jgi:hypothetical protein